MCVPWTCAQAPPFSKQVAVFTFFRIPPACIDRIFLDAGGPSGCGGALEEPRAFHPIPHIFCHKNRTRKRLPAEEARVHPLDVHTGYTFIIVGGSFRAYKKTRPGTHLTFDLRSDIFNDHKSGIKGSQECSFAEENGEIQGYYSVYFVSIILTFAQTCKCSTISTCIMLSFISMYIHKKFCFFASHNR